MGEREQQLTRMFDLAVSSHLVQQRVRSKGLNAARLRKEQEEQEEQEEQAGGEE